MNNFKNVIIVIQNVGAAGKIGGSFSVGIAVGKRFHGLCFELDDADALKVGSFLSRNLNFPIENREAPGFPILSGH